MACGRARGGGQCPRGPRGNVRRLIVVACRPPSTRRFCLLPGRRPRRGGAVRCQQHRVDARERAADRRRRARVHPGDRRLVVGRAGARRPLSLVAGQLPGEVRVAGFSGSGFSARASSCGRVSFADRAPTAVSSRPDLVVVEGGLNDYDQPASDTERGFRDLMRALAGQHVVVVGPASAPSRVHAVPRVDDLLARLSAEYAVPYVATSDLELDYLDDLPPPHRGRARGVRRGGGRAHRGRDPDPARGADELTPSADRAPCPAQLADRAEISGHSCPVTAPGRTFVPARPRPTPPAADAARSRRSRAGPGSRPPGRRRPCGRPSPAPCRGRPGPPPARTCRRGRRRRTGPWR